MLIAKRSYHSIYSLNSFKLFVVFSMLLFTISKPIMVEVYDAEIKTQWFDSTTEVDVEEKETNSNFEGEDESTYHFTSLNKLFEESSMRAYFSLQKYFRDFNLNIQLPPPKI